MKKVIKNNNAGRVLLELQKLLKTSIYSGDYSINNPRTRTILFICGMFFPWIKAIAFYSSFSTSKAWGGELWWEKTANRNPLKKEHFETGETKKIKEFILDNKNKFHELTKYFTSRDKEEFINILFIAFPKHIASVWTEDDHILVNELFFFSNLKHRPITHVQLIIEGEKELEAAFKAEKLIDNIQFEQRRENNH
jgi:hypothetical protein